MPKAWNPEISFKELDEHMENAFKRASGLVGHKITIDSFNTNALASTADSIIDSLTNAGPLFLRVGKGAIDLSSYRPKNTISLKEAAADILDEFHKEAQAAFQASRLRFAAEARTYMLENSIDEKAVDEIISAANNAFIAVPTDKMKTAASAYVTEGLTPGTTACLSALGGIAVILLVIRHPFAIAFAALLAGGLSYFFARKKRRQKALTLMQKLPPDLYNIFKACLASNYSHFKDVVNTALKEK